MLHTPPVKKYPDTWQEILIQVGLSMPQILARSSASGPPRALNNQTVKDRYPLPRIEEMLDQLRGARVFTKFDLTSGYHQIAVASEDVHKTAFRTLGLGFRV